MYKRPYGCSEVRPPPHEHIWSATTIESICSNPDGTPLAVYRQCKICNWYYVEKGAEELGRDLAELLLMIPTDK
jgi:hypothetical protein